MRETSSRQDFMRGIWDENPVLIQLLGLCPALAVTNTVANSLAMGIATFFVLTGSSFLVSLFKKFIPGEVRISAYILIIATFVTIADFVLAAVVPDIHKELGAFIALIVVNCIILGRAELVLDSGGFGNCRVMATTVRHVWAVQYVNAMGNTILDTLEIGRIPAAILAAPEDFEDSARRLDQILETYLS